MSIPKKTKSGVRIDPVTGKADTGRPTVMTPYVINKLEEVFGLGGSDEEACFFADISKQTLYDYQKLHPEFVDRKEALKNKPILKARRTIDKAIETPQYALEYLKRKRKKEFSERSELTGAEGGPIAIEGVEISIRKNESSI